MVTMVLFLLFKTKQKTYGCDRILNQYEARAISMCSMYKEKIIIILAEDDTYP